MASDLLWAWRVMAPAPDLALQIAIECAQARAHLWNAMQALKNDRAAALARARGEETP